MTDASQVIQSLISNEDTKVDFDLDNWITDFENGFLDYEKINPELQAGYWGQGIGNRPRIRELNVEKDAQLSQGYRVVEFFPDRDNKHESYIFFGTPSEIKIQVAIFMNLGNLFKSSDIGTYYGTPSQVWQSEREFKPQVLLQFKEDRINLPKYTQLTPGTIQFRITGEESDTISMAKTTQLATKIKTVFLDNGGYEWEKGRVMCTYTDWAKGYQLQLLCKSETEGKKLAKAVLSIQDHEFQASRFAATNNDEPDAAFSSTPGTQVILGETYEKPKKRPVKKVRFQYAVLQLHGKKEPVVLCDRSNKKIKPLV